MIFNSLEHKLVRACVLDLENIIFFEKEVLNNVSEFSSKRTLRKLINSDKTLFLLVKNRLEQICGYGIITLRYYSKPSGHIYKIAVKDECRRMGLASKILEELEKYAISKSIGKIFAEVRENNAASLELFNKFGYKKSKILFGYYPSNTDSYELENGIKIFKNFS